MTQEDDLFVYKLVGVTIHTGSADHGHYYSIINTARGSAEVDPYAKEE
jgi:ubiquitin C-terminal hydrolase